MQDTDKYFEALVVTKSLALTILVNLQNLQGHAGTNKTHSLIKRDLIWRKMGKDINKFIQMCHICG